MGVQNRGLKCCALETEKYHINRDVLDRPGESWFTVLQRMSLRTELQLDLFLHFSISTSVFNLFVDDTFNEIIWVTCRSMSIGLGNVLFQYRISLLRYKFFQQNSKKLRQYLNQQQWYKKQITPNVSVLHQTLIHLYYLALKICNWKPNDRLSTICLHIFINSITIISFPNCHVFTLYHYLSKNSKIL